MRGTYSETDAVFANPERGFYVMRPPVFHLNADGPPLVAADLAPLREQGITLVHAHYLLSGHRTSDLPQARLDAFEADLEAVREVGLKLIPKFTYVWNQGIEHRDAPLEWTVRHIEQLAPILREHAGVIDHLEGGFVGAWAEWHSSTEGHVDNATLDLTASGRAIVEAMLDALPPERMVTLRYPQQVEAMVGPPVTEADAWDGTDRARVGFFNHGLLYDETDFGTFHPDRAQAQRDWIERATEFTIATGEAAGDDGTGFAFRADAAAAFDRQNLSAFSWDSLDVERTGLYNHWEADGTADALARGLGYRFVLREAELEAAPGGTLDLAFTVENVGFARAHNPRPVVLVLEGPGGARASLDTGLDARWWGEDAPVGASASLALPRGLPPELYEASLWLPDADPSLRDDPRYAVRLANEGTWDPATGLNGLGLLVRVGATAEQGTPGPDRLIGTGEADLLRGRGADDVLWGHGGDDTLRGGLGRDALHGGGGDDVLIGGAGDDRLEGGAGADRFVFWRGSGADRILDFGAGDVLDLRRTGLGTWDDVEAALARAEGGTRLAWGGGSVLLEGVAPLALDAGDVLLG